LSIYDLDDGSSFTVGKQFSIFYLLFIILATAATSAEAQSRVKTTAELLEE
jgi:hypothetical protein